MSRDITRRSWLKGAAALGAGGRALTSIGTGASAGIVPSQAGLTVAARPVHLAVGSVTPGMVRISLLAVEDDGRLQRVPDDGALVAANLPALP